MQIIIKQKDLKAVAYAMADKDVRYYLNGVYVESNGAETRIVATDGARMNIVAISSADSDIVDPASIILPSEFVKALCKAKFPRGLSKEFTLAFDGMKASVTMPDGNDVTCKGIDGTFTNYRMVVPTEASGEYAFLDPDFRLDAAKAWGEYAERKHIMAPEFAYNGSGSAIMADDGFLAIVMPLRSWESSNAPDARFKAELARPVKVAA